MKILCVLFLLISTPALLAADEKSARAANTVILDTQGVKNLGITLVPVEETDFEQTVFAIGRIEEAPEKRAVLSSRIAGRIAAIHAWAGDTVEAGQELVRIESRQPGDPPPVISLKAPTGGLVVESSLSIGGSVEPSDNLLSILDAGEMWAVARVPEHDAARLSPGKTTASISVPALGSEILTGKLLRLGTAADRESGTIDAIFRVTNPGLRLRPGMRAEFSIVTDRRQNVLAVPREAIQGDPAHRIVYVKDFDLPNAFVRTPVQIGAKNERSVEIQSGLFPGDEVVTTGAYLLGFAGGGGISLKEALDAAHGHEHNEDGSEMTAEQRAARSAAKAAQPGEAQEQSTGPLTLFLGITCVVLLALLLLSVFRKPRNATA